MIQLFSNNVLTKLAAPAGIGDLTLSLQDASSLSSPGANEFELVSFYNGTDYEVVKMTSRSGNNLTVERGQEGTAALAYVSGDYAFSGMTAGSARTLQSTIKGVNTQVGTAYTPVLDDAGVLVTMDNAAANDFTVPPESSVDYPLNTVLKVAQFGAGVTTVVAGAGVTINTPHSLVLKSQYQSAKLIKIAADMWLYESDEKLYTKEFTIALSDEITSLAVGINKATWRQSSPVSLIGVRAGVNTPPVGSSIIVDIKRTGTTILSTLLSIDANHNTSTTSVAPAVISVPSLPDDVGMSADITQIGSSVAGKGLKITLIGYPA